MDVAQDRGLQVLLQVGVMEAQGVEDQRVAEGVPRYRGSLGDPGVRDLSTLVRFAGDRGPQFPHTEVLGRSLLDVEPARLIRLQDKQVTDVRPRHLLGEGSHLVVVGEGAREGHHASEIGLVEASAEPDRQFLAQRAKNLLSVLSAAVAKRVDGDRPAH